MKQRFFAPSQYHLHLMATTEREFAWTGQDFPGWQKGLRARLRELIGGLPDRKVPLNVEEIEREETDEYVRLKIVFSAEECADVPAHLVVPKGVERPMPAMICLQGHTPGMHVSIGQAQDDRERDLIAGDRDFAVQAMRHGFVALAVEQRCFGERAEKLQEKRWEHPCLDAVFHSLMLGRTVLGERIWDVMCAIDLLQEQPEVDPDRIACMGNSGGGTVTFYAACLDPRIKLAVPSCSFCAYADSSMKIVHCGDCYIPGILRVAEMGEVAGLIAPRKLLVVAGEEDDISPVGGVRAAFETARGIFAAAGCEDAIRLIVGPEGHRFYAELAWPQIMEMVH
ncbi:MAG: acetylxylan esterase [Candidatus Brocadiae bacterium]|nr:acetylxylan esterase [Candidatus Brocadiia bacterium]